MKVTVDQEYARLTELLREQSSNPEEDVQSFVDAIAFNWLIAGTDAHAKNYALLLGGSGAGTSAGSTI
jgi:serine/threonine-protein kinase HipA